MCHKLCRNSAVKTFRRMPAQRLIFHYVFDPIASHAVIGCLESEAEGRRRGLVVCDEDHEIAAGKFFWMRDMAAALANSFPDYASQLPSGEVPNWMVRMMAPFSARSRMIVHELDRDLSVCAAKATRVLGWQPRPEKEAICASAQSLIDHGLIAAS